MRHKLQENGGIIIELTLLAFLLSLFAVGTQRVHNAFHQRFERIVRERNESIQSARARH